MALKVQMPKPVGREGRVEYLRIRTTVLAELHICPQDRDYRMLKHTFLQMQVGIYIHINTCIYIKKRMYQHMCMFRHMYILYMSRYTVLRVHISGTNDMCSFVC